MGKDADGKSDFIDRFVKLRNTMCQTSKTCGPSEPGYTDRLTDELSGLGMGCVIESFRPSRMPSCRIGDERFVAAHVMEIADMKSSLSIRFVSRTVGSDPAAVFRRSLEELFEAAGMVYTGRFEEFRCLDIGTSEYSRNIRMLSPDVPYLCI